MKSLKFINDLPQEFNLASLRARGCLHEMYKINEKMNNVDSQLELINKMKNSDKITNEIYDSLSSNQSPELKQKKIKLAKLNKFNVNIVKYVRNKDTNLFINEERVRMNKAIESLQKINNNFFNSNNNKNNLLNSIDESTLKSNNSCLNLIKVSPKNRKLLSPIGRYKKIKFKILPETKNNIILNKKNEEQKNNSNLQISKKFFSNSSLPEINLVSPKNDKNKSDNKLKNFLDNIDQNKSQLKKETTKSNYSFANDSKTYIEDESEEDQKIKLPTPKKKFKKRNSVIIKNNSNIKINKSDFLNEITRLKRRSCIGIDQFKINLNILNDDKKNNESKKTERERKKGDVNKIKNDVFSPIFPDSYDIKKYFASPMERVKNIYAVNFAKRKIILPKIKM